MKKRILTAVLALSMAFALAACAPAAPAEDTAATLKMGFIGPLTGGAAIYGEAASKGSQIAVDEINAMGGVQISFNPQDDEHDAEKSVNAYNTLQDWEAQMIIGTVTSGPGIAVATEAFADRMFMLTPSASSLQVVEGNDNVFQMCFTDPKQGIESAMYISTNELATKVAIIYDASDAYSTGIQQAFVEKAAELNIEIVSETSFTADSQSDFTVQVAAAKDAGADLVFLPIYYTPASLILRQADAIDYAPVFLGCDGIDGILTMPGFDTTLAEGMILLTPFVAEAEDAATVAFVTAYKAANDGVVPNQFAANAYDSVYALYAAIGAAAEANGKTMEEMAALTSTEMCEMLVAVFASPEFMTTGLTGVDMTWAADGTVNKLPKAAVITDGAYTVQ